MSVTNAASAAARPKGLNGAWLDYDGRRWVSAGAAVSLTADFTRVGDYRGVKPLFKLVNDADITRISAPARYLGLRRPRTSRLRTSGIRSPSKGLRP